jgi:hypothetical protein
MADATRLIGFRSKLAVMSGEIAPAPLIESRILLIRGAKVLLDRDLAALYQVKPIALRQQVRRNPKRFPPDFLFELTEEETAALLSQNVIPSRRSLGGFRPLAFTEQGVAMLSSVLNSERAVEVNIAIMRTFVRLRQLLATHEDLACQLEELRWRQEERLPAGPGIMELSEGPGSANLAWQQIQSGLLPWKNISNSSGLLRPKVNTAMA